MSQMQKQYYRALLQKDLKLINAGILAAMLVADASTPPPPPDRCRVTRTLCRRHPRTMHPRRVRNQDQDLSVRNAFWTPPTQPPMLPLTLGEKFRVYFYIFVRDLDFLSKSAYLIRVISEDTGMNHENFDSHMLGDVSKDDTIFLDGAGYKKNTEKREEQIISVIEQSTPDYDKEKLLERLEKLSGGVAVLKIQASQSRQWKDVDSSFWEFSRLLNVCSCPDDYRQSLQEESTEIRSRN